MPKNKQKLLQYIDHGKALKKCYLQANLKGQHDQKIKALEQDIYLAQKALAKI